MAVTTTSRAPAVGRAAAVLDFLKHRGIATATEISRDLGIAKSSTANLLETMLQVGLIAQHQDRYVLGGLMDRLSAGFTGRRGILGAFAQTWSRLPTLREHTVTLEVILGTRALCLERRIGRFVLPTTPRIGRRSRLWDGETGAPQLRCVETEALRRVLQRFESQGSSPEESERIVAWRAGERDQNGTAIRRAPQGHVEISLALDRFTGDTAPMVLTAYLPQDSPDATIAVAQADLESLAAALAEAER